jgi:hypothetical protein
MTAWPQLNYQYTLLKNTGHQSIRIPAYVKTLGFQNASEFYFNETTVSDKEDAVSYLEAEPVAEEIKLHAIGESLIHPPWSVNVRTMYGTESHARIKNHR